MNTVEALEKELNELVAKRAAVNAFTAPLKAKRDEWIAKEQEAKAAMDALSSQINAIYEEKDFLAIARKHGIVATALTELRKA